jgi:succinate dehydrogenase / fumarate reductase, cytochrome b subunit
MKNAPYPLNFWRWFDPRSRSLSTWAFVANRVAAIGLTVYLFMHLIVLGRLAQGPEAYNSFIELAHHPVIVFGELLVIAGGILHGLNGIRIALTSFGVGVRYHKQMFIGIVIFTVISTAIFAIRMFGL